MFSLSWGLHVSGLGLGDPGSPSWVTAWGAGTGNHQGDRGWTRGRQVVR